MGATEEGQMRRGLERVQDTTLFCFSLAGVLSGEDFMVHTGPRAHVCMHLA